MILTLRIGHAFCEIHTTAPLKMFGGVFYPVLRPGTPPKLIAFLSEPELLRHMAATQGITNVDAALSLWDDFSK